MDISLLIMASPHEDSNYIIGDIVDVSLIHNDECSHPRFVLVNVTNIPDNAPTKALMKRVKLMLESPVAVDFERREIRRRGWRVNVGLIPISVRQTLLTNRKMTVPWSVAKNYISKRLVISEIDSSQDGNIFLNDEDV